MPGRRWIWILTGALLVPFLIVGAMAGG